MTVGFRMLAVTRAATGFGPGAVDWDAFGWGDDPNWSNPGDGNPLVNGQGWRDASGNGFHLTEVTGTSNFHTGGQNGRSYVTAGSNATVANSDPGRTIAVPQSLVYIGTLPEVNTFGGVMISTRSNSANGPMSYCADDDSGISAYNGSVGTATWADDEAVHIFIVEINGASTKIYVDGSLIATVDVGNSFVGARERLWSYSGAERFSPGVDTYAWGVANGLITDDAGYDNWLTNALDHYGL